jgi:hypothetical protein
LKIVSPIARVYIILESNQHMLNGAPKVLIISYYWPPGSSPGVQRWLKFTKFLPSLGIQPFVLTVKNGSFPSYDESLLDEVPKEVKVYRTRAIEPFALYNMLRGKTGKQVEVGMGNIKNDQNLLSKVANYVRSNYFIPDARVGWNFGAIKKAKKIIQKEQIDLIITTGPPHSTQLIGLQLKTWKPDLKWIADLRDPWTRIYYNQFLNRSKKAQRKDQTLENQVVQKADLLTVVSPGMRDEFSDRAKNIEVVYNGYDEDDLSNIKPQRNDQFVLSYVGNFKASQHIPAFWRALKRMIHEVPEGTIRFKLVGNRSEVIDRQIQEVLGWDAVIEKPFLPHDQALAEMMNSSLLFLPIPQQGNNKSIITGKIFEYLAVRRPILSIGPLDGDAASILRTSERAAMIDYDDEELIFKRLWQEYQNWQNRNKTPLTHTSDAHKVFTRKGMASKMVSLIKQEVHGT